MNRVLIKLFVLIFMLLSGSSVFANYLSDSKVIALKLSPLRIAAYKAVGYCMNHSYSCAITVVDSHRKVKLKVGTNDASGYGLNQSMNNAEMAVLLRSDLSQLEDLSRTEMVYATRIGEALTLNRNYRFTRGGGAPLIVGGQLIGGVGVNVRTSHGSTFKNQDLLDMVKSEILKLYKNPDYFKQQNDLFLDHVNQPDAYISRLFLEMTVPTFSACHQYKIACTISVVNLYGTQVFEASQDHAAPSTLPVAIARASITAVTGVKYNARLTSRQQQTQTSLAGYDFLNGFSLIPVTPGSEPWVARKLFMGGIGVASSLRGASPIYWQRYNRLVASLASHYLKKNDGRSIYGSSTCHPLYSPRA